ncbi:MAG: MarC family protein, partial [Rhizobiaceae bacterium]
AFTTFFVIIDPPGLVAIFLAVTAGMTSVERRKVALRGSVTGIAIILAFMFIGGPLLATLGISLSAFRVAGGLLLFYTAFEMVFEKREERKGEAAEKTISEHDLRSIAVFPLAVPLIAGPGSISVAILLGEDFQWPFDRVILIAILLAVGIILYLFLLAADRLNTYIGDTGRIIMTRLMGILLAALSVQFIADGIKTMMS